MPTVHTPAWHVSAPLQTLPSVHDVPLSTETCWHPVSGSHESVVHGLPSSQSGTAPALQIPPRQVSSPLQALRSLHEVPSARGRCWQPETGSHVSVVQGLLSLHCAAVLHSVVVVLEVVLEVVVVLVGVVEVEAVVEVLVEVLVLGDVLDVEDVLLDVLVVLVVEVEVVLLVVVDVVVVVLVLVVVVVGGSWQLPATHTITIGQVTQSVFITQVAGHV